MKLIKIWLLGIVLLVLLVLFFFYFGFLSSNATNVVIQFSDVNQNQIWDDVEPFINKNAQTISQKKALEYKFKSFQEILLNPELGKILKNHRSPEVKLPIQEGKVMASNDEYTSLVPEQEKDEMLKSNACLLKTYSGQLPFKIEELESAILNSSARIKAYLRFNKNLGGGVYYLWNEETQGDPCNSL
jgi:hypothetical protein